MAIVYVVDVSPNGYPTGTQYVPTGGDNVLVSVGDTMDALSIVQSIERSLRPGTFIEKLHLASHGNSGELFMGMGLSIFNVGEFRRLSSRFVRGAFRVGILVHGCAVASTVSVSATDARSDFGVTPGIAAPGIDSSIFCSTKTTIFLTNFLGKQFNISA